MPSYVIENPLELLPDILKIDLNRNLCVCNEVKRIDVINAIANGAKTLEQVREKTYASDGNGCCRRQVCRLIESLWQIECVIPKD
jgi:bacterioferritin-associated ferredoxin